MFYLLLSDNYFSQKKIFFTIENFQSKSKGTNDEFLLCGYSRSTRKPDFEYSKRRKMFDKHFLYFFVKMIWVKMFNSCQFYITPSNHSVTSLVRVVLFEWAYQHPKWNRKNRITKINSWKKKVTLITKITKCYAFQFGG